MVGSIHNENGIIAVFACVSVRFGCNYMYSWTNCILPLMIVSACMWGVCLSDFRKSGGWSARNYSWSCGICLCAFRFWLSSQPSIQESVKYLRILSHVIACQPSDSFPFWFRLLDVLACQDNERDYMQLRKNCLNILFEACSSSSYFNVTHSEPKNLVRWIFLQRFKIR